MFSVSARWSDEEVERRHDPQDEDRERHRRLGQPQQLEPREDEKHRGDRQGEPDHPEVLWGAILSGEKPDRSWRINASTSCNNGGGAGNIAEDSGF